MEERVTMPENFTQRPSDAMEDEMCKRTVSKANLSANHADKYSPLASSKLEGHRRNMSVMKSSERVHDYSRQATKQRNILKLNSPAPHHPAAPDATETSSHAVVEPAGILVDLQSKPENRFHGNMGDEDNQDMTCAKLSVGVTQRCKQATHVLQPAWKQCFERLADLQLSVDAVRQEHMILQQSLHKEKLTRELEKARERVDKDNIELQRLKDQSRSGCFTNFLRVVSFLGLLLFLDVTVSGDGILFFRDAYQGSYHGLS